MAFAEDIGREYFEKYSMQLNVLFSNAFSQMEMMSRLLNRSYYLSKYSQKPFKVV